MVVLYFSPCNAASNYLTDTDRQRLQQVFKSVWPPKDLPSVHYAVLGSQLLGEAVPNEQVRILNLFCLFIFRRMCNKAIG